MPETRSSHQVNLKIFVPNESNTRSHVCGICSMSFKRKKDLKDHKRFHPIAKPHACKNCGKRFVTAKHLEQHLRMVHGPKRFVCEEGCAKTFVRESDMRAHSILHETKKPYRCAECGKRFKTKRFLKSHYNVHKTAATFVPASEVTGKRRKETSTNSESSDLDDHSSQTKIRVFTCDICNQHFRRNFNLMRHRASHLKKIFTCVACPEVQFKDIGSREKHYTIYHLGKPFKCSICDRLFRTKANTDRHFRTHLDKISLTEK